MRKQKVTGALNLNTNIQNLLFRLETNVELEVNVLKMS